MLSKLNRGMGALCTTQEWVQVRGYTTRWRQRHNEQTSMRFELISCGAGEAEALELENETRKKVGLC